MSVTDERWSLEDEVEVIYTVWSCHHQEEQELVGIFTDATKGYQLPDRLYSQRQI
jgi:hypothetical protein